MGHRNLRTHSRHSGLGSARILRRRFAFRCLAQGRGNHQMSDFLSTIWMVLIWTVNGFLVIIYYAFDHVSTILLVGSATAFVWYTPKEQRAWAAGSSALAIVSSYAAPLP